MANPNIDLLGAVYPAVSGIELPKQGGGTATFPWVEGSQSITQNGTVDVTNLAEVVVNVSGGSGNDFIVTLTLNDQTDTWEPDCTFAELYAAYQAEKTIAWVTTDGEQTARGHYNSSANGFEYYVEEYFDDSTGEGYISHGALLDSNGVTDYGRDDPAYFTYYADAVPSDVANGKVFFNADGFQTGTASGGGASNMVSGTFKGTTAGAAMDISLPYTGSGYPIVVAIYPKTGYGSDTAIYSLLQRYAVVSFSAVKRTNVTPTYSGSNAENQMFVLTIRKSSATTASSLSANTSYNEAVYNSNGAGTQATTCMRFKDSKTMSVYIVSSSYGFAANIEYTYYVIYSS